MTVVGREQHRKPQLWNQLTGNMREDIPVRLAFVPRSDLLILDLDSYKTQNALRTHPQKSKNQTSVAVVRQLWCEK